MNRNLSLFIALATITSMASMTGCSNKNTSYYAEVTTTAVSESMQDEPAEEAISLKYTDTINSNTVSGIAIPANNPYYKSQLPEPSQRAFEEIISGVIEYRDYITLSTSITEDELLKIMNIIMTNVPDAFHLDFSYKYDLNVSGYIKNFYPIYTMDYATYASAKDTVERNLISYCENKGRTEYDFVSSVYSNVYKQISTKPLATIEPSDKIPLTKDSYISQSITSETFGQNFTSLGAAKFIQYYCNYMGIENVVVIGDLVEHDFNLQNIYRKDKIKTTDNDGIFTTRMDINNFHAWNLINLGGVWTNCDVFLDAYFNEKDFSEFGAFLCVPDEVVRQTRLFYINNELLGLTPPCTSNNYQYNARNGFFITSYSKEKVMDCVDTFIENLDYNKLENAIVQFETESNYHTFCDLFEERLALYNQTHNNAIPKYKVMNRDYSLTFEITEVIFA